MIQRIQTVYLALAFVAMGLLFIFPVLSFSASSKYLSSMHSMIHIPVNETSKDLNFKIYAFEETADLPATSQNPDFQETFTLNALVIGFAMVLVIACIFLFKNRKNQLTVCWVAVIIMITCAALIYVRIKPDELPLEGRQLGAGSVCLSIALILTVLASRGIRSDEALVRSADRLR